MHKVVQKKIKHSLWCMVPAVVRNFLCIEVNMKKFEKLSDTKWWVAKSRQVLANPKVNARVNIILEFTINTLDYFFFSFKN